MTSRRELLIGSLSAIAPAFAAQPVISNLTVEGQVNNPYGLRTGPDGALYICEIGNHRVSRLDLSSRRITSIVDGQKEPYELQFDSAGRLFFVDMPAHVVRMFDPKRGNAATVAGTGVPGFSGDGGPALEAQFKQPHSIAFHPDGRLLVCDIGNHRIRWIDLAKRTIGTFAGTGEQKPTPEGAAVEGTPINGPRAIAFDRAGDLFLVLREGNVVLRVTNGRYYRIAGTGEKGYSGDGGDARLAKLSGPKGISSAPDGSIYIADTESHTIRRIDRHGIISTVAGAGARGDGPPGNPLQCKLSRPHGVFAAANGTVYISDSESNRIRVLA